MQPAHIAEGLRPPEHLVHSVGIFIGYQTVEDDLQHSLLHLFALISGLQPGKTGQGVDVLLRQIIAHIAGLGLFRLAGVKGYEILTEGGLVKDPAAAVAAGNGVFVKAVQKTVHEQLAGIVWLEGVLNDDQTIVSEAGQNNEVLAGGEGGPGVFHDDGDLALLQPLLGLPPVKILLTGQTQLPNGILQPLHIGFPIPAEVVDQLLRGVFPVRHVGGNHGKAGHAASIGGNGSAAVFDVGVIGLKKQGNRVVGDGFRLCLGYGRFLGFRRKGFHESSGFGDSGLCFRALPCAGAEHGGHQRER